MAYIGSIPAYQASGVRPRDEFTADGTQICFPLSQSVPGSFESGVTIVLDNVPQQPVEAFTVVDTRTLTLTSITGTFTVNETVTGGTSTATGTVIKVNLGSIVIRPLTGTFSSSESITGGSSAATATTTNVSINTGSGILFSEIPVSGSVIYVVHEGNATYNLVPAAASVSATQLADNLRNFTVDTFTGDGTTTAFTLTDTPASANALLVMVDGIVQTRTTNYTLATNVVTFTGAPDSGSSITIIHLGFSTISRTGLVDGSVTTSKIADGSITSAKILDGTIVNGDINASAAIAYSKLNLSNSLVAGDIASNAITTAKVADTAITPAKMANSGAELGMRNRIINGAMVIDQRNAGASITTNAYCPDRWLPEQTTDGVRTAQQVSDAPTGFVNSLKLTTTTADASLAATQYSIVRQGIEGYNTADLMWGTASAATVTLSFWVKSSLTGTFGGVFGNSAFNRSYPFTYTISSANTWEQKTVTIAGDTTGTWEKTNSAGIQLYFGLGAGSTYSGTAGAWTGSGLVTATGTVNVMGTLNATWQITGVQLEKGSTATSFDYRPYSAELAMCQRYYWKSGLVSESIGATGYMNAGNAVWAQFCFPVTMRATPTVTVNGTWAVANTGQPTIRASSQTNFMLQLIASATGIATAYPNSSDDFLDASIEL